MSMLPKQQPDRCIVASYTDGVFSVVWRGVDLDAAVVQAMKSVGLTILFHDGIEPHSWEEAVDGRKFLARYEAGQSREDVKRQVVAGLRHYVSMRWKRGQGIRVIIDGEIHDARFGSWLPGTPTAQVRLHQFIREDTGPHVVSAWPLVFVHVLDII